MSDCSDRETGSPGFSQSLSLISNRQGFKEWRLAELTGHWAQMLLPRTRHPGVQKPRVTPVCADTAAVGGAESPQCSPGARTGQEGPADSPRRPFPQLGLVAHVDLPHPGEDKRESKLMGPGGAAPPSQPWELQPGGGVWGVSRSRPTGDPTAPTEPTMPLYPRGPWGEEAGAGQPWLHTRGQRAIGAALAGHTALPTPDSLTISPLGPTMPG